MLRQPLKHIFPQPPAGIDPAALDPARVPAHVAVIMDGNGRWAKKRALNRLKGHKAGIEAVRETIRAANDCGVDYLTIYSFSTENWKRPEDEVTGLMELFAKTMLAEVDGLDEENVRVNTIGDLSLLPLPTQEAFVSAWEQTKDNSGMTLNVAINYGARQELVNAFRRMLDQGDAAQLAALSDEALEAEVEKNLYTAGMPDPDLVIRTSGESRLSNFLMWQLAYAEIHVTEVLWPDFNRYDFLKALLDFQNRERRYGAV